MLTKTISLTPEQWETVRTSLIGWEPRDETELMNQIAAMVAMRDPLPYQTGTATARIVQPVDDSE